MKKITLILLILASINLSYSQPLWNFTNTGFYHTIIIQDTIPVTIDGVQVSSGDYIGVFYDLNGGWLACAGYAQWTGSPISLLAYGTLSGQNNGFATSESFKWRIWRASDSIEFIATATYIQPPIMPNANTYYNGGVSGISLIESFSTDYQYIDLPQGWSYFSTYIEPFEPNIDSLCAPFVPNIIIAKNGIGNVYWPQYGINVIGNLIIGEAYQIKTTAALNITIEGFAVVPENTPVIIPQGWSFLGYLRTTPDSINIMLSPIVSNVSIVKNTAGLTYWPLWGVNAIGNMVPGEGYQIKMLAQDTLLYPPNSIPYQFACGDTISDYHGNYYNTVLIGSQCWMKENMKTTHFPDGTAIPLKTLYAVWVNLSFSAKAYCYYNNSMANSAIYGNLYTWNAAMYGAVSSSTVPSGVQGICPTGWHLPSDEEWTILEGEVDSQYSYPDSVWNVNGGHRGYDAALNLKTSSGWYLNGNGTDLYGFSALPGGYRLNGFSGLTNSGHWWSSTKDLTYNAFTRQLYYNHNDSYRGSHWTNDGSSVRCLKD